MGVSKHRFFVIPYFTKKKQQLKMKASTELLAHSSLSQDRRWGLAHGGWG